MSERRIFRGSVRRYGPRGACNGDRWTVPAAANCVSAPLAGVGGRERRAVPLAAMLASALLIGAVLGLAACGAGPGAGESATAQRSAGEDVYQRRCAACHQGGGIGAELTPATLAARDDAQRLWAYLRISMPYDDPGSLDPEAYWAVTAYLLSSRGMLPPEVRLTPENAAGIRLAAP